MIERHAGAGQARGDPRRQRDAEIREHGAIIAVEQHVFGLHIAMHHATRVRVGEGVEQRAQQRQHVRLVGAQVAMAEVAARQEGHHVVEPAIAGAPHFEDVHDVRVLQPRDGARLVFEALRLLLVHAGHRQHDLDCHLAVQRFLDRQPDGGHAALSDFPHHAVARNHGRIR